MAYDAAVIANNFLNRSFSTNMPLTCDTLQELLFLADRRHQAASGERLIVEEFTEDPRTGPYIQAVEDRCSCFGLDPVTAFLGTREYGGLLEADEDEEPDVGQVLSDTWDHFVWTVTTAAGGFAPEEPSWLSTVRGVWDTCVSFFQRATRGYQEAA